MSFFRALASLSILATFTVLTHAFVMIDDFTVGDYSARITGVGNDTSFIDGLDKNHVAFGQRATDFKVAVNNFCVPVDLRIGGGEAKIVLPQGRGHSMVTELHIEYGNVGNNLVDFSQETEFWIDQYTRNPDGRFADQSRITVRDASGQSAANTGWLSRDGGIFFRKNGFVGGAVDWSRIKFFRLLEEYNTASGDHPEIASVQRMYAVPEPSLFIGSFLLIGLAARRRRAAKKSST